MSNCGRCARFARARRGFFTLLLAIFSGAAIAAAQTARPASGSKPAGSAAANPAPPSDAKKNDNSKLKKLVQEHKVLTNEDFEKSHATEAANSGAEPKSGGEQKLAVSTANGTICDDECADEARGRTDLGEDEEGEWQAQLASARHFIATDANWKDAYWKGFDSVRTYCGFQRQQQNAVLPSGSDYHSRYLRAQREQYNEEMNHTLGFNAQSASERLQRIVDEAGETDPVRAAVMSVLADRALNQCATPIDP